MKIAEDFKPRAYRGLYANNLTIGYGHVVKSRESFGTLTKLQVTKLLKKDLQEYDRERNKFLKKSKLHLKQYQYDALIQLMLGLISGQMAKALNLLNYFKVVNLQKHKLDLNSYHTLTIQIEVEN